MEKSIFENLRVYQQAINFVSKVYQETASFPKEEIYGLTSQFRRAAVSIPLNIAESQGRQTRADKKNFISIAKGSAYELLALIDIVTQLNLINKSQKEALRTETFSIIRQLNQLINFYR